MGGEEEREVGRDYGEVVNGHTKEIVNCIEMHTTCGYCKLINKMWSPPASSLYRSAYMSVHLPRLTLNPAWLLLPRCRTSAKTLSAAVRRARRERQKTNPLYGVCRWRRRQPKRMRLSRKNNEIRLKIGRAVADCVAVVIDSRAPTIDDNNVAADDRLSRFATVERGKCCQTVIILIYNYLMILYLHCCCRERSFQCLWSRCCSHCCPIWYCAVKNLY